MSEQKEIDLCILFFYHKCDELTLRHYSSLVSSNPDARILPLTNAVSEYLPDSVDVAEFAAEWAVSQPWRNIDVTLYAWFLNRKFSAKRYVLIEYDCFCNVNLKAHYADVWDADVAGVDYFTLRRNPRWEWFKQSELQKLSSDARPHAAGVVPFVGMMFSHAALEKIVGIVSRDDLFCELRLGTAIRKLKLKFKRLPLKARATICWHPYPFQINNPGLFHGIKSLSHNSGKEKQPGRIAALFYDLKRSFNRQRILKQNRPQQ
jgi:hypothetical protein